MNLRGKLPLQVLASLAQGALRQKRQDELQCLGQLIEGCGADAFDF